MPDTGNLLGTTRTLDRVRGSDVQLEPGLISRDGWTVVTTARALYSILMIPRSLKASRVHGRG